MLSPEHNITAEWLIETYFSDPARFLRVSAGDVLMRKNGLNARLYLVRSGRLKGYAEEADGERFEVLSAGPGTFVGLLSYFSRTYTASWTVVADEDTEVAYITQSQEATPIEGAPHLLDQFMPVVMKEIARRQRSEFLATRERERALRKLIRTEKMATLGQMAAGIAHELNNVIAVITRNTGWLSEQLSSTWQEELGAAYPYYRKGLDKGRHLSTAEVRKQARALRKELDIDPEVAEALAEMGLAGQEAEKVLKGRSGPLEQLHHLWDMGVTLHDIRVAAEHATHVVKSVRTLGAVRSIRKPAQDINESLEEAMALLASPLRTIDVQQDLRPLPGVLANLGELVQVWSNLIKNACESMTLAGISRPTLRVSSQATESHILVSVQDNGPGIPLELLPDIFRPHVTTKPDGLSCGMGLGLTIVERIVQSYEGTISVDSRPGETIFTVRLPLDVSGASGKEKEAQP